MKAIVVTDQAAGRVPSPFLGNFGFSTHPGITWAEVPSESGRKNNAPPNAIGMEAIRAPHRIKWFIT